MVLGAGRVVTRSGIRVYRYSYTVIVPFVALTALGDGVDGAKPTGSIIIAVPLRVSPTYVLAVPG